MHIPSQLDPLVYWRQQRCRRWCACLVVGLLGFGLGREATLGIQALTRERMTKLEWMVEQIDRLSTITPRPRGIGEARAFIGLENYLVCLLPRDGMVTVADGTCFHVVSHSYHDGEWAPWWLRHLPLGHEVWRRVHNTRVGDVTIAMTTDGALYANFGQVCGCPAIYPEHRILGKADFLASRMGSRPEEGRWHQLRPAPQKDR